MNKIAIIIGGIIVVVIIAIIIAVVVYLKNKSSTSTKTSTTPTPTTPTSTTPTSTTSTTTSVLPAGITEGEVIYCPTDGGVYLVQNGQLRHYTWPGYVAAGSPKYTPVSCDLIKTMTQGPEINS